MTDVLGARTLLTYISEAYSVPNSETLVPVTSVNRGGSVTTTQLTVATGKTLRVSRISITGVLLGTTVAATSVRLRANLAGAATLTSPIVTSLRMGNMSIGTQAANYAMEPLRIDFPEGLEFP